MRINIKSYGCLTVVFLGLCLSIGPRPGGASTEGTAKKVAIIPFTLPTAGGDREWISAGFAHVLALRLQQLAALKVSVLPRALAAGTDVPPALTYSLDPLALLERLRPQGYDAIYWVSSISLRARCASKFMSGPHGRSALAARCRAIARTRPGCVGKQNNPCHSGGAEIPASEQEGRGLVERYTSSAEAFERFARALSLADPTSEALDVVS